MAPHVSGNYGSRSHVSKTQSTWADLQKARMNEEDNKTKWSPAGIFDDARTHYAFYLLATSFVFC